MTAPEGKVSPHDTEADDRIHIRCEACDVKPYRAVCGVRLDNQDEVPEDTAVDCPTCNELWGLHNATIHGIA